MAQAAITIDYDDEDDLADLEQAAQTYDLQVRQAPQGFDVVLAIILVGSVAAVAGAFAHWLQSRHRKGRAAWGQVVDLRPGVPPDDVIRRDSDLEFGQIVVITPSSDGKTYTVSIEVYHPGNDFEDLAKLIFGKLADGVVKPLDTIAQAAKDAVGDKGKVKVMEGAGA